VEPIDTGGGFRAAHRQQDPAVDPREPNGGESGSRGQDHGWSGCTCSSAAVAIQYQSPFGSKAPWGGDMRHRQSDLEGGTDLYDMRAAWSSYGETLTIRTGAGWEGVKAAHAERRAIIAQGEGEVPGAQTFDGGHACVIGPETHADGRWLFSDPLADGWQWVEPSAIRSWMERWESSCAFAVGEKPPADPPPEPEPTPPPPAPAPDRYWEGHREGYTAGVVDGRNLEADRVFASWHPGRPTPAPELPSGRWDDTPWDAGSWTPPWPIPLAQLRASMTPAEWHEAIWAGALWRG